MGYFQIKNCELMIVKRVQEARPQPKRFDQKVQICNEEIVNWFSTAYNGAVSCKMSISQCKWQI